MHFNYVYDLPWGKGRLYLTHMPAAADALIGGWAFRPLRLAVGLRPYAHRRGRITHR